MTYILSDLEGSSIADTIKIICKNETNPNIIITGNIIDSNMNTFDVETLKNYKSNNLMNINYCMITKNLKLLLGNKDLHKIKLYNALNINVNASISHNKSQEFTTLQRIEFEKFNNGNVDINTDNFNKYFSGNITWKYPLSDFLPIWNQTNLEQYLTYTTELNYKSNFIVRFKYIFIITMGAGNLLYSIPQEISNNRHIQNKHDSQLSTIINMTPIYNYLKLGGKIDHQIDNIMFNNYAFIVCAVFISLLHPETDTNTSINFYNSNNSNFCKSFLYKLYNNKTTLMIYLDNEKYLLSNGGITKYCINLFKNMDDITAFMIKIDDFNSIYNIKYFTNTDIIKKFYNNDNKENKDPIENNNFNLSYNDLNLAITNCNVIFKKWILDSYTDQKNLQYILYMTTESTNASVIYTDPFNINGKQYCSPSGSGIVSLTDSNIQYISDDKPIIQIFGHNSFGFANSFYEINEKNMLVCLDVSNSFSEKYKSYNYIYIKDDNLTSISNVCLKKSDLSTKCYESISYPSQNSILYHNNNYIQDQDKDLIFLNISNNVTIINSIIKYTNYEKVFLLLNKNFNNEDLSSKLIYNGYIHINNFNDPFFVFSVINGSFKDFYILLFSDIYYIKFYREIKKIFSKGDERSKNYNDSTKEMFNTFDTLTNEIRENYEMLNKQSVVNSYRLKKYLKYKNKYLKLRK